MLKLMYLLASVVFVTACQSGQLTSITLDRSADIGTANDGGRGLDGGNVLDSAVQMDSSTLDSAVAVDSGQAADAGTDTGPVCEPSCGSAICGDDGCGGSCGSCASGVCSAGQCQIEGCPPAGPFGAGVGQTAPNITLYDCDGNPVELHSLCGNRVAHLYAFAEWCPSCRTYVRGQMENQHNSFAAMGDMTTWLVVTAVTSGSLDATGCRRIRESYGINTPGVTVLYDPTGQTNSALGMFANAHDLVLSRRNKIVINARYSAHLGLPQAFANTTP